MASSEFSHPLKLSFEFLYLSCILILMVETKNLSVEEVRCQVNQAHNYMHTAIDLLKTAQSKLPEDINIVTKSSCLVENNLIGSDVDNEQRVSNHSGNPRVINCQSNSLDCGDIYEEGERKNGVYKIWPRSRIFEGPIDVYCDLESDERGWTVIQRRGDFGSSEDYFYKDWYSYKSGFGELEKDFWIGNDKLFVLTNQKNYTLRIDISTWVNVTKYAEYKNFWVDSVQLNYTLHVNGYSGTAGDSLSYHNGFQFSTKDRDNDASSGKCAETHKGGWWYQSCHHSNLNGLYYKGGRIPGSSDGVSWYHSTSSHYSHKNVVMKIKAQLK